MIPHPLFLIQLVCWIILVVEVVKRGRKINRLEAQLRGKELDPHNSFAKSLQELGKVATSAALPMSSFTVHHCSGCRCLPGEVDGPGRQSFENYSDKDGDGVPDAFQRRKPISEILEFEKESSGHANDYWVAIELPARYPRDGEHFIYSNKLFQTLGGDFHTKAIIVKSVPGTNLDDLVDLTK